MSRLVVTLGDQVLFDRIVHNVECEQTAAGSLAVSANYPPVKGDWESTTFTDVIIDDGRGDR